MATYLIIPVDPAYASQRFKIGLDGLSYQMQFDWNEWAQNWTVSIYTDGGTAIYEGRFLAVGLNPFGGLANPSAPPGLFTLISNTGSDDPPTRYELGAGARCQLCYATALE